MKHTDEPYDRLIDDDGTFMLRDLHGSNAKRYLDTPEVTITAREKFHELDSRDVNYIFKLSTQPDLHWVALFEECVERLPRPLGTVDADIKVSRQQLILRCIPANLEARFPLAKAAVAATNVEYQNYKSQVRSELAAFVARKTEAARSAALRTLHIQKAFDDLPM